MLATAFPCIQILIEALLQANVPICCWGNSKACVHVQLTSSPLKPHYAADASPATPCAATAAGAAQG